MSPLPAYAQLQFAVLDWIPQPAPVHDRPPKDEALSLEDQSSYLWAARKPHLRYTTCTWDPGFLHHSCKEHEQALPCVQHTDMHIPHKHNTMPHSEPGQQMHHQLHVHNDQMSMQRSVQQANVQSVQCHQGVSMQMGRECEFDEFNELGELNEFCELRELNSGLIAPVLAPLDFRREEPGMPPAATSTA